MSQLTSNTLWKLLLVSSLLVVALGFHAFINLDTNISGDGIPNRPQKEPPIEYPWNQAAQFIFIMVLSITTAVYSGSKVFDTSKKGQLN
ncbi:MAG: hypothetical protein ACFFCW_41320 [Candidatus Hodarchaeota archaeon]